MSRNTIYVQGRAVLIVHFSLVQWIINSLAFLLRTMGVFLSNKTGYQLHVSWQDEILSESQFRNFCCPKWPDWKCCKTYVLHAGWDLDLILRWPPSKQSISTSTKLDGIRINMELLKQNSQFDMYWNSSPWCLLRAAHFRIREDASTADLPQRCK